MEYTLIPTRLLQKLERVADMIDRGQLVPAGETELLDKKGWMQRTGRSEEAWYHLIRTGPASIVKRKGNGGNNVRVMVDYQAYLKQYQTIK